MVEGLSQNELTPLRSMLTLQLALSNYKLGVPQIGLLSQHRPKRYLKVEISEQNPRSAESESLGAKPRKASPTAQRDCLNANRVGLGSHGRIPYPGRNKQASRCVL